MARHLVLPLFAALVACADPKATLSRAAIDTLPGGIIRVMSPGPTAWADTTGWKLVETLRIEGSTDDSTVLNNPRSLALDGLGRIWVVDENPSVIKVFDIDGRLVRTVGHQGAGPGEFEKGSIVVAGANVVLHDQELGRTSVFDTAGRFLRSWTSPCCYRHPLVVDTSGLIYVNGWPGDSGGMYARYGMDGTARDTMFFAREPRPRQWTFKGGTVNDRVIMITNVPLTPRTERAVNPDGGLIFGWSEQYQIVVSPHGQDTAMVFGRIWIASPLPQWRREAELESAIAGIAREWGEEAARAQATISDIPTMPPAFTGISVDGRGNRWITVDPSDDSTHTWFDVFDPGGAYLGRVVAPPGMDSWLMAWSRDEMVAYLENAEGEPVVLKFRIETNAAK